MATLIAIDGTEKNVFPRNGMDFKLEELQGFVDGYIETIMLSDKELMVVNEEGLLFGLPLNKRATKMMSDKKGVYYPIVGNALVCENGQIL